MGFGTALLCFLPWSWLSDLAAYLPRKFGGGLVSGHVTGDEVWRLWEGFQVPP